MAIKSADQISIVDITDAYSVILTSDSYTFPGTTNAAKPGSCETQVIAMRGSQQIPASVNVSNITKPTGITVTKDDDANAPTLTITANSSFATAGVVEIPVVLESGSVTINKKFSVAIAFTGATGAQGPQGDTGKGVESITTTYQAGTSNVTPPTGTWASDPPSVPAGQYLWTKMVLNYTDGTDSQPVYSVAKQGATGAIGSQGPQGDTGNGVESTTITYQAGTSNVTPPTGSWVSDPPSVPAGQYLWTKMVMNYTDGSHSDPIYSVAKQGETGAAGADAITMTITSSAGTIFKNTAIVTTLTAHVYKAGVEVTGSALSALGTIKWYKDGGDTATATGQTLTISAGDVTNKATYVAQLEG